jgi:small subunit ribosomal protein S2
MEIQLKDLLEAGSHFGHQVRRWNPGMKQYIYGERDGVHIFDLAKSKAGLEAAAEFARSTVANGGVILYVGTKRQASEVIKSEAIRAGMPYLSQRWMAGLLTNFGQLSKSVRRMIDLKDKREKGELKKYTKKEQLLLSREIEKLEKFFGGVVSMDKIPAAMFVVDTHREDVAVREANKVNIPVLGMVDSNGDPTKVDYVIPVNDDAAKSIELIVKVITDSIIEGKTGVKAEVKPVEPEEKVEEKPVKKTRAKKVKKEE